MYSLKKIVYVFLATAAVFPTISFADDGAFYSQGSTIIPIKHTTISLKKEVLTLKRKGNHLFVDVAFEFFNPGAEHEEIVGFVSPPCFGENFDEVGKLPDISNFTVEVNGANLKYKISRLGKSGFRLPVAVDTGKNDFVYYFKVKFIAGINKIHHTYTMRSNVSPMRYTDFSYRLTTGNSWANGEMEDFTLHIDMGKDDMYELPSTFNQSGNNIEWVADSSAKISCGSRWVSVEGVDDTTTDCFIVVHSGGVTFHATHFKPQFDLDFGEPEFDTYNDMQHVLHAIDQSDYPHIEDSSQFKGMNDRQLSFCKNYFFALHGCEFKNKEYSDFFGQFVWYFPYPNRKPDVAMLNKTERHVLAFIEREEKQRPRTKPAER